jgi:hypothetical protein
MRPALSPLRALVCPQAAILAMLSISLLAWTGPAVGLAAEEILVDGVPHVRNGAEPAAGVEILQLQELWRAGGDDDEVFFGVITDVIVDDAGQYYLLDAQLGQVHVFSAEGKFLRTLSREGDGPGEVRRPREIVFMPDGTLGLAQMFPGKIVQIDRDGTPAGSWIPGGDKPGEGGFRVLRNVRYRGGNFVVCAGGMSQTDDGFTRTTYLASCNPDGSEKHRYLEQVQHPDFGNPRFNELEEYFPQNNAWALGPDGRLYTAAERDKYAIHVTTPDGILERVIEREFKPWKRSQQDKDRVLDGVVMIINNERVVPDAKIEDHDPCVVSIRVMDDGSIWALNSLGNREQPDGILQTYDVFDPQGQLVKQVAVACEGDGREDELHILGNGRYVLVRGLFDAFQSMYGGSGSEDGDANMAAAAPLEVICFGAEG